MESLLSARRVSFSYAGEPTLAGIDLQLSEGSLRALVGPNGSGKTTLLKLLAGILPPGEGEVKWGTKSVRLFSRRELARKLALVPQEQNLAFNFTVRELVMLGRTPYLAAFAGPRPVDRQAVDRILELTEITGLAARSVTELSGGEKQRVIIAMALAQEPRVLLLDEPTVHLDLNHQIEILELLKSLNRQSGLTVLATMHDLNLAALYFDELTMLKQGRIIASDVPSAVLSAEQIRLVFDAAVEVQPHPHRPDAPQIVLLPKSERDTD